MKSVVMILVVAVQLLAGASSESHLGVVDDRLKETTKGKSTRPWLRTIEDDEYGFGSLEGLTEWHRELDMSLSLSLNYHVKPSLSPIYVPVTDHSTSLPTSTLSRNPSILPSTSPSLSSVPSTSRAATPILSPNPSLFLPSLLSPNEGPSDIIDVYECSNGTAIRTTQVANDTTLINLSVAYAAEIDGSDISDEALSGLETILLQTVIEAALDCDDATDSGRRLVEQKRELLASTDTLGNCNATSENSTCFVLESDLAFTINDVANPQYSAYIAYLALQRNMNNGIFLENLGSFIGLTYLAPLPLVPPPNNTQPLDVFRNQSGNDGNTTKSWTIGACVAMSTGGFLALAAWIYSRRVRNKRHIEIPDERSLSPVSLFSAEHEYTGGA